MITQAYVAELAAFNKWQNDVVFDLCDGIGEAERLADRGMFFGSIHHTLDHICMVTRALVNYLNEDVPPPSTYGEMIWPDWQDLKSVRVDQDQLLAECAATWREDWMAKTIAVNSPRMKQPRQMPRWILITQLFNHQTHHRSQVTSELHKMGLKYGSTDIPFRPGGGYFVD